MPSIDLGWQADLNNTGSNRWRQQLTGRAITATSFQLAVSVITAPVQASDGQKPAQNNQVLFVVQWMPALPVTSGPGPDYPSGGFFTSSDWGPMGTDDANHLAVDQGGWQGGGYLASIILKLFGPSSRNKCPVIPMNLSVPAGAYLLAHMDHTGDALCDCEMQGVLHYG